MSDANRFNSAVNNTELVGIANPPHDSIDVEAGNGRGLEAESPALSKPQSIVRGSEQKGHAPERVMCACFDLTNTPALQQFGWLSLGVFVFFQVNAYVEEFFFKNLPKFTYGGYLTFFELCCFAGFGAIERFWNGERILAHRAPVHEHAMIAVWMAFARGLTNISLQYLNYPTQVIFKSMKLITALIGSALWLRNKHKVGEFIAAGLLVASAVLFTLGDAGVSDKAAPSAAAAAAATVAAAVADGPAAIAAGSAAVASSVASGVATATVVEAVPWFGIVIVLASLVFDSLHSNSQERVMKTLEAGQSETMIFTNLFSAILLFVWIVFSGEIGPAIEYCSNYPMAYPYWIVRASVIYYGVKCFLALIKTNGNVLATSVTTVRKIVSILLSFLIFPKPFTMNYVYGVVAFFLSFIFNLQVIVESNRAKEAERARQKTAGV